MFVCSHIYTILKCLMSSLLSLEEQSSERDLIKQTKKMYVGVGLAEDARLRAKTNVCLGTSASIQVICFYFLLSTSLMQ